MKTKQMTFQKFVVFAAYILCALTFFYALIFATPFYPFFYLESYDYSIFELYEAIQPFNRTLFTLSVIFLLIGVSMIVYFARNRRRYYLSNFITTGLFSAYGIFYSIFALTNIFDYMAKFQAVDIEAVIAWATETSRANPSVFNDSIATFIIGIIIFVLIIAVSIALIINLVWKQIDKKRELKKFAEIDAKIYAERAEKERKLMEDMT